ncbi:MAG: bacteriohemerythrin [Acidobacteriia bacterium]|nr:bacteriohemerythrin [Terriglobia bacterium]
MSIFLWKDEYSVGYAAIDSQHKRLFQLADELHAAMASGKGKDVISTTLANLINYTKVHFAAEEGLMKKYNYPEYPQHKQLHDQLTTKVVQFQKDFEASRTSMTVQLMQFLKDWLTHHIGQTDKKIAAYLREQAA